jgi:hypothetical protein
VLKGAMVSQLTHTFASRLSTARSKIAVQLHALSTGIPQDFVYIVDFAVHLLQAQIYYSEDN